MEIGRSNAGPWCNVHMGDPLGWGIYQVGGLAGHYPVGAQGASLAGGFGTLVPCKVFV